jgi:hypothetical protein
MMCPLVEADMDAMRVFFAILLLSAYEAGAQTSTDNLQTNFGIPKRLSDCDIPAHPVTPDMPEALRSTTINTNYLERQVCRQRWQAEQDDRAARAQKERVDQFIEYNKTHNESVDPDGSLRAGAAAAAKASLEEDQRKRKK